jgi:hypothetical protein
MLLTDDTVQSAAAFKTLMVVSKIGDFHHDKPEIKEFVNDFLKKLKSPSKKDSFASIASSYVFGFSVSEIIFGLDKKLRKVPTRVATYHPSTIAFEVDESGCVTENGVLQYTLQYTQNANPNNTWSRVGYGFRVVNPFTTPTDRLQPLRLPFVYNYGLVKIPRNKVIHHVSMPNFSFGNPYGQTSVRTAHLAWQLKVFLMRQLGIAAKRNATNTLWATAPSHQNKVKMVNPDGTSEELTPAQALKKMMGVRESDDAVITGPETDGYKVESLSNQANLDQIGAAINLCDVRIFRCFLLPSLVMTDGSAGSRSLGDKHFQVVDRICEDEAESLGETIRNDLVERTIIENFGEQDDYGYFEKRPQSIEERQRLQSMFLDAVNGGILKNYSKKDMDFMRSTLYYPQDEDQSLEVKGKPEAEEQVAEPADPTQKDAPEPKEPKDEK